jgi:cell division protease FtsH
VNNFGKNIAIWVLMGLLLVTLFNLFQGGQDRSGVVKMPYSEFLSSVKSNQVAEVKIQGNTISGRLNDGRLIQTYTFSDSNLANTLSEKGVKVNVTPLEDKMSSFWGIFFSWFPMLLFIGVWIFFMRQMQGGGGKAMGFGKSKARLMTEHAGRKTFADVAGVEEAKQEVQEVVEFLKDPQKFQRLGGKIPKGVLLIGPPGTGKTLLARAIAGEANVPFFSISGSDFVEMFVGVGASRVRDMFEQGKKSAPCLIFIDELDAVGRHRGAGLGGGNDEREQTLNQLLVEMDGFESNEGVILIAATNRPDVLDPALLRPGRFDRQVVVPNPDVGGREEILRVHTRKLPSLASDVDPKIIARSTPGFSGAELANLVNEAALLAARKGRKNVSMQEFEEAKDKVLMGVERRSLAMTEDEKKLTAYHEGGHALVGIHMAASDPIHKATIVPRGRALGMVMRLPEGDRLSVSKERLLADLAVAMGGRVAEELVFGMDKVTTGASSDIEMATSMARKMVTEWGMSEKLGPLLYGEPEREVFLGHTVTQRKNMSDTTAHEVDQEIRYFVEGGYNQAKDILTKNLDKLHIIAKGLIEFETLSGDEIQALLKGKKIAKDEKKKAASSKRSSVPSSEETEDNKTEETKD